MHFTFWFLYHSHSFQPYGVGSPLSSVSDQDLSVVLSDSSFADGQMGVKKSLLRLLCTCKILF